MQASNIGCLKGSLYLHVYENNIYPQLAGAFVQLCCLKASLHVTLRLSRVSAFDIQNFALSGLQKTCRIAAMRQESRRSVRCRCDMPPAVKTILLFFLECFISESICRPDSVSHLEVSHLKPELYAAIHLRRHRKKKGGAAPLALSAKSFTDKECRDDSHFARLRRSISLMKCSKQICSE